MGRRAVDTGRLGGLGHGWLPAFAQHGDGGVEDGSARAGSLIGAIGGLTASRHDA
jgi:hypothetical protein